MRTTFRSALFAAVAAAAVAPAWAQPAPRPPADQDGRGPGAMFDRLDGNKDGRVTWDEAWGYVQQRFASADADRDGGVTRQEAEALRPARRGPGGTQGAPPADQAARQSRWGDIMFRGVDANRDGRVTLDEVRPMVEARFRGFDADGDNAVSRNEIPQRRPGPRRDGDGRGQRSDQVPAAPR